MFLITVFLASFHVLSFYSSVFVTLGQDFVGAISQVSLYSQKLTFADVNSLDDDCMYDPGLTFLIGWRPYKFDSGVKVMGPSLCHAVQSLSSNSSESTLNGSDKNFIFFTPTWVLYARLAEEETND